MKKKKQDPIPVPVIYVDNGMGETITIKSPVLLSIFQSKDLIKEFEEDPDRKYSVKEIFEMRNKNIPVKEATIRRCLSENQLFFETKKDIDIQKKKGRKTVVIINMTKLKPLSKAVFEAVKTIQEAFQEDDDDE